MKSRRPGDQRRVTRGEFEEWARPRLMLFLSADIEHSTRLKQQARNTSEWLPKVFDFISEFPAEFQSSRETRAVESGGAAPAPQPTWKVLGDEVIFAIEIRDTARVREETEAFATALLAWNSSRSIMIKGAAWMAGFPVANTLIPVVGRSGGLEADYIGPSMDAGFRLSKAATSRRLVVSVELAWWILHHAGPSAAACGLDLHFQGCLIHKGLAEETGYPLIWIGIRSPRFQTQEDHLLGRNTSDREVTLRDLCKNFIEEFGVPAHLPFLHHAASGPECAAAAGDPPFQEKLLRARELIGSVLLEVEEENDPAPVAEENAAETEAHILSERLENLFGPDRPAL